METNSKKNIDLTYLKELSNGSNEFIIQMITIFLKETPTAMDNIEQYVKTSNWDALRAAVHKMKPSFAFMGIKELESTINSIEKYSETKTNLDLIPDMISKVKTVLKAAIQELETVKKEFL
jgi:HPt (histidine-containing phosphotransfer) domain-containing protein